MALKQPVDLGTIYTKTGSGGLGTAPTFGNAVVADRASKIRIEVTATLAGGSTSGNLTLKMQSSRDGTNWDAGTITDDGAGTTAATATMTTTAGATVRASYSFDPSGYKGGVRMSVNTAGAASASDTVTIVAEAV